MRQPDLFELTPELRKQAVAALGRLLSSDEPAVALAAVSVLVEMDGMNLAAARGANVLPPPSNN